MSLTLLVAFSLLIYRVTRFVLRDSMLDGTRAKFEQWLLDPARAHIPIWREKLYELSVCPYCVSVWVSAGCVAVAQHWTSVPLPVYVWLACAGGAMVVWRIVEVEE